jgi:hypothetical protein
LATETVERRRAAYGAGHVVARVKIALIEIFIAIVPGPATFAVTFVATDCVLANLIIVTWIVDLTFVYVLVASLALPAFVTDTLVAARKIVT